MKLIFLAVGSKHEAYVQPGIEDFTRRIQHYLACEWKILTASRQPNVERIRREESETIYTYWQKHVAYQVLLDERGKLLSSSDFATCIATAALHGRKAICFTIGGAFGVEDELRTKADLVLSLGKMVFPHQLVRLMLAEQVYRACTINRGEKYHHI